MKILEVQTGVLTKHFETLFHSNTIFIFALEYTGADTELTTGGANFWGLLRVALTH